MQTLSTAFAALGDPVRFAIVERLLQQGELSAGMLCEEADISPPAISRHLKVLRQAGLLEQRIDAQRRLYSVRPAAVRAIGTWVINHRKFWETSLDRLEKVLEDEEI